LKILKFTPQDASKWDDFCNTSYHSTFLHTRKFISYHKKKFKDHSIIIESNGKWLGVFPAAEDQEDSTSIISHPGITYGGVIHHGDLRGQAMIDALSLVKDYYSKNNYNKLVYKKIPYIYHQAPSCDDNYALFILRAKLIRCDLSSTIDNNCRLKISDRRKRSFKKAISNKITIVDSLILLPKFWVILKENLKIKYNKLPVHSLDEISILSSLFPENIKCISAIHEDKVIAGVLLFISSTVFHSQYIASNDVGRDLSALDAIFEYCIDISKKHNKRWFDFGISNQNDGLNLNSRLYAYKSEFGAGSIPHEFYQINLKEKL
jgi:Acetyltransferase (GNAT) domain